MAISEQDATQTAEMKEAIESHSNPVEPIYMRVTYKDLAAMYPVEIERNIILLLRNAGAPVEITNCEPHLRAGMILKTDRLDLCCSDCEWRP